MKVDVYYDSAWHNIHDGVLNQDDWTEIGIGSTKTVDKARICLKYGVTTYVGEFDFNQVSGGTTHYGAATLSGTGALAALARATFAGKAALAGTGALAAAAHRIRSASAAMSGTGSLSAAGTVIEAAVYGSATLSGTGSLAASPRLILAATATMSGAGALSARAVYTVIATVTLSGEGTLTAAGTVGPGILYGAATLSGSGSLYASATTYRASPTLLAAQKNARRTPYVEAKVYDHQQGIKRLSWTRLYTGSEPDNYHGIAFDGQGSMHRIRAATGDKLYYQKVSSPRPASDYTQWTEIATDCAGPCAITASGGKVYIFYRTSTNVLWKYYSHNYGQDWSNAQLYALADVLSLAAAWKGTTGIAVCFAATAVKVSAITLDTGTQTPAEYYLNHGLDTTYGIGATYRDGEFPIVLGGKDTDSGTGIVTYALYRTTFTAQSSFVALRILIGAHDDVATAFKYPDCHIPTAPYTYETIQLTVVEDYSGVTAYTRPLLAHLVKGTSWGDATITEPGPFLDLSSAYGVRLMSTVDHWWLSTPSGVWRAPREATTPLDLTPYIVQLRQVIKDRKPGSLVLILDNSRGYFSSPGEGELASLRFRAEIVLKLGYKTGQGNETAVSLTYWVDGWQYSSSPNRSLFTLHCLDLWGLAGAWSARYSLRWNYTDYQPSRVWEILYQLLGRTGIRLWNNPDVGKSSTMDNYYPVFLSRGGTNGDTQLRRLLSFVTDSLVPRAALCFAKDLLSTESSCYEYRNAPGYHAILAGAFADNLTTTHTQVSGDTQDEPPVHVREAAFDWDLLALGIDNLRMQYDANLEEATQAAKRADALLRHEVLESQGDHLLIPTNVAQELYDVVTVTDARCGISAEKYRVLGIQTDYDRRKGQYDQLLTLGAP
jgi:hypothetical protein